MNGLGLRIHGLPYKSIRFQAGFLQGDPQMFDSGNENVYIIEIRQSKEVYIFIIR